jgi:hypothetical protein
VPPLYELFLFAAIQRKRKMERKMEMAREMEMGDIGNGE